MSSPSASLESRRAYAERVSGHLSPAVWWDAVAVTVSSAQHAGHVLAEMRRRQEQAKIPAGVYLAVADPNGRRIGNGGATLNALRALSSNLSRGWSEARVLVIHAGGERFEASKLFSALPVTTPWGEPSTVFDELLILSSAWMDRLPPGLVVAAGDVLLQFDPAQVEWARAGATGVALKQPVAAAAAHGVYVADPQGRVYTYLQKSSAADVERAGGLLEGGRAAIDSGLMRFEAALTARLARLANSCTESIPYLDLYRHFSMAITGQWKLGHGEHPALAELHELLNNQPFWCSVLDGEFTHMGSARGVRKLAEWAPLYEARQRREIATPEGVRSAGVIVDSVLAPGSEVGSGAIVMECDLAAPVTLGPGAVLQGASGVARAIEVPAGIVCHQVPVAIPHGPSGVVVRVYGAEDDARETRWMDQPVGRALQRLGLDADAVWPGIEPAARVLWNAELFPVGSVEDAWRAAAWLCGIGADYSLAEWRAARRLSLDSSSRFQDLAAISAGHVRRLHSAWRRTAISLARSGADLAPLLANAPGIAAIAGAAREIEADASRLGGAATLDAASQHFRAGLFFAKAGLDEAASRSQDAAFDRVQSAVNDGAAQACEWPAAGEWAATQILCSAPPRIDLGGGWSDTPPFCLDWGGTVLNIAVELDNQCPIRTSIRRIDDLEIRAIAGPNDRAVFTTAEQVLAPAAPGSPFTLVRQALVLARIVGPGQELRRALRARGGGLEISTSVDLPMGSGLGTSSILGATVVRALAAMCGLNMTEAQLVDEVMRLEQMMTTGGGWQDQVGGIYPGAKIVTSGPGLRQRLRVQPVDWTPEREQEFASRLVLYNTGLQRMAKNLLRQVVGSYLARETATVQVLHGIKTLAVEMGFAMREGEWAYLGKLIDRHWQFNQVLDPHTTNAPIDNILARVRPFVAGAKLAGAGGGGYLILIAHDPDAAARLRTELGRVEPVSIARRGLRIDMQV